MAGTWYPVVDYMLCAECGSCAGKCAHGVYDPAKAPVPVVLRPEACVDHCHGCGNLCPTGAITYLSEDTGWTPPHRRADTGADGCRCGEPDEDAQAACAPGCGCGCDGAAQPEHAVTVEYLYLDLAECDRCIGTAQALDEVLAALTPALAMAGYTLRCQKIEMATAELAAQYRLLASPTVRVNGRDIAAGVRENHCGCCSAISHSDVDCRVFEYNGHTYEVAPKQMLARAILSAVCNVQPASPGQETYRLPDHLARFFAGKR